MLRNNYRSDPEASTLYPSSSTSWQHKHSTTLGITEHLLHLHQAPAPSSVPNSIFVLIRQIFTGDLSAVMAVNVFNCVDVTLSRSVLWLETVRSNTRQKRTKRMRSNPSATASNPMACACGFAPMTSCTSLTRHAPFFRRFSCREDVAHKTYVPSNCRFMEGTCI